MSQQQNSKTAILLGASGLVGQQLLPLLLESNRYKKVTSLGRKQLPIKHPKLTQLTIDFDQLNTLGSTLQCDDIFCCLGTTLKAAKSKTAFRRVDYDYPLQLAKLAKAQGATQWLQISSLGARAC